MSKKRIRKPTITQQIMQPALEKLAKYQHDLTRKQYIREIKRYVKFCREHFDSRTFSECTNHVQAYSDYLQKEGCTASTIHTYLSPVCTVFEVDLSKIQKPIRYVANYTRGRLPTTLDAKSDLENPEWFYIVEFEKRVGIRRDELKRLCKGDFCYDESGYASVLVRRGKGGKRQLQRILEKDVAFVKDYFDSNNPHE